VNQPNWRSVVKDYVVPARPEGGLWTIAVEYLIGPRKLKITARGDWSLNGSRTCGPDGDETASGGIGGCLTDTAPRGCLIGKIGGGTADLKASVLPLGRFAVIELPDPAGATAPVPRGGLFLTMNDEPSAFSRHEGSLIVDIWEAS
jgi:hypothetical protein